MKKIALNIGLPFALLLVAIFIIGPACTPTSLNHKWYLDNDQDGFGVTTDTPIRATENNQPDGYVKERGDCDDNNPNVYPGATEIPDNLIDEDCNGKIDITFYADKDEDGFGNPNTPVVLEIDNYDSDAPTGYSWYAGDCNDNNANINPKADEIAGNGIDDNCDGNIDIVEYYIDADGDGYGSTDFSAAQGVTNNIDCDDTNPKVNPYIKEYIDGIDNNCDGIIDLAL